MPVQLSVAKTGFKVPIYMIHATEGPLMPFDDFKILYSSMYDEPRFALIVNLSAFNDAPWSYVQPLVKMLQDLRPKTQVQLLGSSIIVTSTIVRWAIMGAIKQYPMCAPYSIVDNLTDASSFIQSL